MQQEKVVSAPDLFGTGQPNPKAELVQSNQPELWSRSWLTTSALLFVSAAVLAQHRNHFLKINLVPATAAEADHVQESRLILMIFFLCCKTPPGPTQ